MALYVLDENGKMINFHTWSARRNAKAKQEQEKSVLEKAKEIIRSLYSIIQGRIDYKNNIPLNDEMYRAEQFLQADVDSKNYEEQDKILKTNLK